MIREEVVCSFYKKCKNYGVYCNKCKWNANIEFDDYLLIVDDDGKTLKIL